MKVIIHDLDEAYDEKLRQRCDATVLADGRYAACQGCFNCWTTHPAECRFKDKLHTVSRVAGKADELIIITENLYGGYSTPIKTVLDRNIGSSTPLSTYRGGEMHHTLRYGKCTMLQVIVYGDITPAERETFTYLVERNRINEGFEQAEISFLASPSELEVEAL